MYVFLSPKRYSYAYKESMYTIKMEFGEAGVYIMQYIMVRRREGGGTDGENQKGGKVKCLFIPLPVCSRNVPQYTKKWREKHFFLL